MRNSLRTERTVSTEIYKQPPSLAVSADSDRAEPMVSAGDDYVVAMEPASDTVEGDVSYHAYAR